MKLALFGVGNAGTRLVDRLLAAESALDGSLTAGNAIAFNTTPSAFAAADQLEDEQMVVIGDTHPDVVAPEDAGADRREGVGGDLHLGVEAARDDLPEIRRALDTVDDTEVDAALVVAGLGGGTGAGLGSVLLEELKSIYEIPVYVLGVLPASDESDRRAWTAARAIRTVVPLADAVLPVDNEAWDADASAAPVEDGEDDDATEPFAAVNEAVAERVVSLFAVGEREGPPLSELRMDPNDIGRTLEVGGLATIGHARTELDVESEGWFDRFRRLLGFDVPEPEPQTDAMGIKQLVKRALESRLTLPCDVSTADRVLLVLSGPPRELSRKGFETGRKLLEDETGTVEILAGDEPLDDAESITATVLLSNVTEVPRIEALQERAVDFEREQAVDEGSTDETPATEQSAAAEPNSKAATTDASTAEQPPAAEPEMGDERETDGEPTPDRTVDGQADKPEADDEATDDQAVDEQAASDKEDGQETGEEADEDGEHGFQFEDEDPESSTDEESDDYTVKDPFN
ncbi:cell division protein FtsZ [Halohasta salina]|uniref:cell division protein FtsZ n=1 Tax=Halohasta salina TaxID=2961621 RepID=UPI0020A52025|nr:cell division protein FtsZ [Halohasta salina]